MKIEEKIETHLSQCTKEEQKQQEADNIDKTVQTQLNPSRIEKEHKTPYPMYPLPLLSLMGYSQFIHMCVSPFHSSFMHMKWKEADNRGKTRQEKEHPSQI